MSSIRTNRKIIALFVVAVLILGIFVGMPTTTTAAPLGLSDPTGLQWGKIENRGYFAMWDWSNLDDFDDDDIFEVEVYDENGNYTGIGNTFPKWGIVQVLQTDWDWPGIPVDLKYDDFGVYSFTLQILNQDRTVYSEIVKLADNKRLIITPDGDNIEEIGYYYDDSDDYFGGGSSGGNGGSRRRSGSGGSASSSATATRATPSAPTTITSGSISAASKGTGEVTVQAAAWKKLSGSKFQHDTVDSNGVQVRLTINDPASITKDLKVSGYTSGITVETVQSRFGKHFRNTTRVLHLDQAGSFGQEVRIAAKLDLTGMDTGNLYFYSYDAETNKYKQIQNPNYRIDSNGYIHFSTILAGSIVVSDGPLAKQ